MTDITWTNDTRKLSDLVPWERNPKRISKTHAARLLELWERLGQFQTIAIGPSGEVYDGHQRLSVLKAAHGGKYEVQALQSSRALTEKEREELTVAAHVGTVGQFDWDALSGWDVGDLQQWGFDTETLANWQTDIGALRTMLDAEAAPVGDDPGAQVDKAAELREKWGVNPGDLWALGEHRLICGDCTDREVVAKVMDEIPGICVTDPPYGVNYDPQWRSDAADAGHLAYADRRVGKVANDDRADWSAAWALFPGDVIYSWHPAGATSLVHAQALQDSGFVLRMQIIWAKSNFPIGRGDYHVRHEPCWYAVRDGKPAKRTKDRTQTTLWEINLDKNVDGGHSTQKPLECMERPIRNHEFDVVYDPFLGSGTTLIACERLGRRCRACEISPEYVGVALERFYQMTGKTPVLVDGNDNGK